MTRVEVAEAVLLHETFERTARRLPDKPALVYQGERWSYAQVAARVEALAAALAQGGVHRGDRVILFLDNGVEMVAGVYAALRLGAIFVPVNPLTKRDKLEYLLADTRAAAMVTHRALMPAWEAALAASPTVHTCLVAGEAAGLPPRCVALPHETVGDAPCESATIDQDLAAIIYTSGSTGHAKGVMLSHLNMVSAARSVSGYLGLAESDVVICVLPLAFDYGLYQVLMAFKVGATVVLERSFAFPAKVLEAMARERVTVLPGVPTLFAMLTDLPIVADYDLRWLRMVTNTAAALPVEHIRRLRALFPGAALFSMYGLTECKRVTYLPPDQLDIRPTSVGRGMPNEEVWLVDEAGARLPNGSIGELVIRGSNVMRGYWEKPVETAERLRMGPGGEVMLHSGDIFRTDAEGWLYFVARKDDIIKSRGEKVSPREVENAICALDAVREAAVVGVPDEVLGEAIKAFVVLKQGRSLTEREVIRHCLGCLENFMAPRYVEFVEELPKTDTGKVRRAALA